MKKYRNQKMEKNYRYCINYNGGTKEMKIYLKSKQGLYDAEAEYNLIATNDYPNKLLL